MTNPIDITTAAILDEAEWLAVTDLERRSNDTLRARVEDIPEHIKATEAGQAILERRRQLARKDFR